MWSEKMLLKSFWRCHRVAKQNKLSDTEMMCKIQHLESRIPAKMNAVWLQVETLPSRSFYPSDIIISVLSDIDILRPLVGFAIENVLIRYPPFRIASI